MNLAAKLARWWPLGCAVAAVLVVAACGGSGGSGSYEPESRPGGASAPAGELPSDLSQQLCRQVDTALVRRVVGAKHATGQPTEDSWGWSCRWDGDYLPVGPNGQVLSSVLEIRLYREPAVVTNGTGAPTPVTIGGRPGTTARPGPRTCTIAVRGSERTLTVTVTAPADRHDECAPARAAAEHLVTLVLR
jgi:hypothetical protein